MPTSAYLAQQVAELVRRGVDEARHGNRAAAAALLRRAVQLDPQHEAAWLWLGGVAAGPEEAAFALRAALQLNPANEAARRGLSELEAAGLQPQVAAPIAARPSDSRWRRWRESRSAARSLGVLLWVLPIVLLIATAGLRLSLTLQTPAAQTPAAEPRLVAKSAPTAVPPTPVPAATATPPPAPTLVPFPTPTQRSAVMAYLVSMDLVRQQLRGATDAYLTAGDRRTTAERAAAARALRDEVQRAREQLTAVVPPSEARDAHGLYLDGLAREAEALDDVLAFYAEYNLARSNSATLRMQQARAAIDSAAKQWDTLAQRYGIGFPSSGQE